MAGSAPASNKLASGPSYSNSVANGFLQRLSMDGLTFHRSMPGAARMAPAAILNVFSMCSVRSLRPAGLGVCLRFVARPAKQLALLKLRLNSTLGPTPNAVINLRSRDYVIELQPITTSALHAACAMQGHILFAARSYPSPLVFELRCTIGVSHDSSEFSAPTTTSP